MPKPFNGKNSTFIEKPIKYKIKFQVKKQEATEN